MVQSIARGPVVIGRHGVHYLETGEVEGKDPLANFEADASDQLRRLNQFPNVGDILVNSMYDPSTGEVAAFEELVGSHGGLGGDQTQAFLLYPSDWPAPPGPVDGPEDIYHLFRFWLGFGNGNWRTSSEKLADVRASDEVIAS